MIRILTINDGDFAPYSFPDCDIKYQRYVINPGEYTKEIIIAPHYCETYLSYQLLRLWMYCQNNRIKIISVGTMNQLPLFGMFSDEVILQPSNLNTLFTPESSFGGTITHLKSIPQFRDVYTRFDENKASESILTEDVVRAFMEPKVYLRKSTVDLFQKLELPQNAICCEIKKHFYPKLYSLLEKHKLIGLDKTWQKTMAGNIGDHFMGIQILACVKKGWRFIAAGGSVNLFSIIPIHTALALETQFDFGFEHQEIFKKLSYHRYGTIPQTISFPHRIFISRKMEDDDSCINETALDNIISAKQCDNVEHTIEQHIALPTKAVSVNQVGQSYVYARLGFPDVDIELCPDHSIKNSPGDCEHGWRQSQGKLCFYSADNMNRVEMAPLPNGEYAGIFVNNANHLPVRLIPSSQFSMPHCITLKVGKRKIRWAFAYPHDMKFAEKNVLPWALPHAERISDEGKVDFMVGVYLTPPMIDRFANIRGRKFLLSCEEETRHKFLPDAYSFVQNPQPKDDINYIRYAPTLCCWVPPITSIKTQPLSIVESGQYEWRRNLVNETKAKIKSLDVYGRMKRPLEGYHQFCERSAVGNDKYIGIQNHAFYLAIERDVADDYITEKFTDAIMCESIPVYKGAENILVYCVPEAFIPFNDLYKIDWENWVNEYSKRQSAILKQKEFLRSHLNVFSYFERLSDNLSLLNKVRPITL